MARQREEVRLKHFTMNAIRGAGQMEFGSADFELVYVGGNSDNVSNGNAGPSYVNCNNLSNSNSNNGARLNLT